jgi:hypothetical protein
LVFRLIPLAAAALAFGLSVAGSFHFDDYALLTDPAITSARGWLDVWRTTQTRPLTWFTFWANYQIGGTHPAGYHLVNLILHLACVWLVSGVPARHARVAAILFAVHPLQAEAVNYVFARGNLLMALLCLLSLREWTSGRHWRAAVWFVPALLAKEECAAFPLFLLLLHLSISRNRRELAPIGAMAALSLAAGLRVIWTTTVVAGAGSGFAAPVTPFAYLAAQGVAILRYLRLFLVPVGFTADPDIQTGYTWLAWLVLIVLALLAARRFASAREGFWFLSALALLLPSSSVFPAADLAADRRMYLPMFALAMCAAILLDKVRDRYIWIVASVLILTSAVRTYVWRTEESLWSEAVARAPLKVRPRIQLARAVTPERAIPILDGASALAPDDPAIPSELGRVYLTLNQPDRALAAFGRALALSPNDPKAVNNRGAALLALGQAEAAKADFLRVLTLQPCFFDSLLNLKRAGFPQPVPAECHFTPGQISALKEP